MHVKMVELEPKLQGFNSFLHAHFATYAKASLPIAKDLASISIGLTEFGLYGLRLFSMIIKKRIYNLTGQKKDSNIIPDHSGIALFLQFLPLQQFATFSINKK